MSRRLGLLLLTAVGVCLLIVSGARAWRSGGQQPAQAGNALARVVNKTEALQVVAVTDANAGGDAARSALRITVKNVSGQGVVEFTFVKADGSELLTSGATTGWELASGESNTVTVSVSPGGAEVVTLAAALFEDGAGQGLPQEVARLKDYRAGVREQFERAYPALRRTAEAPAEQLPSAIPTLQARLSELSEPKAGGDVSPDKASGLRHAKEFLKRQVRLPGEAAAAVDDHKSQDAKAGVGDALAHVEKALLKLRRQRYVDGKREM